MKIQELYLKTSAVLLFATGLIKVISSFGSVLILSGRDDIFGIQNSHLLRMVGGVEIIAALVIFSRIDTYKRALCQLGIALCFLIYRIGLSWMGVARPCPCLGNATAWLGLSRHTGDVLAKWVLAYLLLGSALVLALQTLKGRKTTVSITASPSLEHGTPVEN